jgi:hypothetical protein
MSVVTTKDGVQIYFKAGGARASKEAPRRTTMELWPFPRWSLPPTYKEDLVAFARQRRLPAAHVARGG